MPVSQLHSIITVHTFRCSLILHSSLLTFLLSFACTSVFLAPMLNSDTGTLLTPSFQSESVLLYDWQFTANQFVLAPSPLRPTARIFFRNWTPAVIVLITSYLTREWVCHLQLLLALASAFILGSEPHGTHDHISLSQICNRSLSPGVMLQNFIILMLGT
jgi:hypothetical protein